MYKRLTSSHNWGNEARHTLNRFIRLFPILVILLSLYEERHATPIFASKGNLKTVYQ